MCFTFLSSFTFHPLSSFLISYSSFLKKKDEHPPPDCCTRHLILCLSHFPAFFHCPVLFAFPSDQQLALTGVTVYCTFMIGAVNQERQLKLYLDIYIYKSTFNIFSKGSLDYKVVEVCENVCVCMCVCVCVYVHTHTHTHTYFYMFCVYVRVRVHGPVCT